MAVVRFQRRKATKRDSIPCRWLTMTRYSVLVWRSGESWPPYLPL